jgi:HD-GYP domain-containing protein (c-di-GMP phosphodiesterase class II)
MAPPEVTLARRGALVHDAGLVAVPTFLLDNAGHWSESDRERFRLHTYYTERILASSEHLRSIGETGGAHHERRDGSGYHRGLSGNHFTAPARAVAVAAAYVEAEEQSTEGDAGQVIAALKDRGLDQDCLGALAAELGTRQPAQARRSWPAGLTEREVEVLRLIATGLNLKETAKHLVISDHTARHHVESIYSKAGVSSRAGVTLFAVENGLVGPAPA